MLHQGIKVDGKDEVLDCASSSFKPGHHQSMQQPSHIDLWSSFSCLKGRL